MLNLIMLDTFNYQTVAAFMSSPNFTCNNTPTMSTPGQFELSLSTLTLNTRAPQTGERGTGVAYNLTTPNGTFISQQAYTVDPILGGITLTRTFNPTTIQTHQTGTGVTGIPLSTLTISGIMNWIVAYGIPTNGSLLPGIPTILQSTSNVTTPEVTPTNITYSVPSTTLDILGAVQTCTTYGTGDTPTTISVNNVTSAATTPTQNFTLYSTTNLGVPCQTVITTSSTPTIAEMQSLTTTVNVA